MKKILTVLLAVLLITSFFTACTSKTVTPTKTTTPSSTVTPGQSEDPYSPTPTPKVEVAEKYIPKFAEGDIIEFNIFNTSDYQSRWNSETKEYLLKNYMLKVANEIPGISGFETIPEVKGGSYMDSESKRLEYNSKIALLMLTDDTTPDFWTSLFASSIAVDAPWTDLAPYLVDLSPYLEEDGPLYEGYINWVWEGNQDYWYKFKSYLETEDGELYALPRREMMPTRTFLGWNANMLTQIGLTYEQRATDWQTLIDQLKAAKVQSGTGIPFQTYMGNLKDVIAFVASTYGLDFSDSFAWTTKNGEPLWTYIWSEYLNILTDVMTLAQEHLIYNDKTKKDLPIGYDLDPSNKAYKQVVGATSKWHSIANSSTLIMYSGEETIAQINSHAGSKSASDIKISDTWVTHSGYEYSMTASSEFDFDYLAISNRIDKQRGDTEFTNRICAYMAECMSDDAQYTYFWGPQGIPFADTADEAGNWDYMEIDGEMKVWFTGHANRFSWTKDTAEAGWNQWFWEGRSENWYAEEVDPHYAQYIAHILEVGEKQYGKELPENRQSNADIVGITDTGCFDNLESRGIYFFGDITAYPMQDTAYWRMESMSKCKAACDTVTENCKKNNGIVATGFFRSTSYVLGTESAAMNEKIIAIKKIAKNYTVDFLSGNKDASSWTQYINSLKDAGYMDVYNYYNSALESCVTEHIDTIKSQSTINATL